MEMELWEREALREFLVEVYGPSAQQWPMNEKVFNLTYQMILDANECSEIIDLVPRPMPPGAQPLKWITKQVRQMLFRAMKEKKVRLKACTSTIAAYRKPAIGIAAMGG